MLSSKNESPIFKNIPNSLNIFFQDFFTFIKKLFFDKKNRIKLRLVYISAKFTLMLSSHYKKVLLLLKSVIFNYHGLDEHEQKILKETAEKMNATEELQWVNEFILQDDLSAFDRARGFFNTVIAEFTKEQRLEIIRQIWEANRSKGYVSEIEAASLLKIAKDWGVQSDFITYVRNSHNST